MNPEAPNGSTSAESSREITIEVDEDHHSHDIKIKGADLEAGTGVTYSSSIECEHSHTVTLTPEMITELNAGAARTVASNPDATGHGHAWLIQEPK